MFPDKDSGGSGGGGGGVKVRTYPYATGSNAKAQPSSDILRYRCKPMTMPFAGFASATSKTVHARARLSELWKEKEKAKSEKEESGNGP